MVTSQALAAGRASDDVLWVFDVLNGQKRRWYTVAGGDWLRGGGNVTWCMMFYKKLLIHQ